MRPVFVSVILIAAHISAEVDCRAVSRLQHMTGGDRSGTRWGLSAGGTRLSSGQNGAMRGGVYRGLLGEPYPKFDSKRTATNNFVSTFDLRRKQFLCTDSNGQLIHSRRSLDCFLRRLRVNLAKRRDVFPSPSGQQLLKQGGGDVPNREPPGARRRRRSKEVNPSDPLMSETHPSLPAKDGDKSQPDQDQAGAVSKETIASCDDPLRVLRPNGAGSPVKTNIADRAEHS